MRTRNWLPSLLIVTALTGCCAKPEIKYLASPPQKPQVDSALMSEPEPEVAKHSLNSGDLAGKASHRNEQNCRKQDLKHKFTCLSS